MNNILDVTVEDLNNMLVQLIKIDNIKDKIIKKAKSIESKLKENEIIELKVVKDGKQFKVIFNIINKSLPKCFIINHEYKFNSYIAETIIFTESEYK